MARDQFGTYQTHAEREAAKARTAEQIERPHTFRAQKGNPNGCKTCGYAPTAPRHAGVHRVLR